MPPDSVNLIWAIKLKAVLLRPAINKGTGCRRRRFIGFRRIFSMVFDRVVKWC